ASDLRGAYLPLRGSQSCEICPGGMTSHQEERLRSAEMLFSEPDSLLKLSAGLGLQWPDARGVFVGSSQGLYVWCNEEDHLRFCARGQGSDVKQLWQTVTAAMGAVEESAKTVGRSFCSSNHFGFTTSCPSRLGSALRVTITLKIPLLAKAVDLSALCRSLGLHCGSETVLGHSSVWQVSSGDCLGVSECDLLNTTMSGCRRLVVLEQLLEQGEGIFDAMPGLGDELPPSLMPVTGRCPPRLPDIGSRKTLAAAALRADPGLYKRLRTLSTSGGANIGTCIRPTVDSWAVGGASVCTGLVVGEQECLDTFRDLFDAVLALLPKAPALLDLEEMEADEDRACVWVRAELRRNLQGLKLAPCCGVDERREAERLLVGAMLQAEATPEGGQYLPLASSLSYSPRPHGMEEDEQRRLCAEGLVFSAPTDSRSLAAGIGRSWPDARGAFLVPSMADAEQLLAWINEEDHLRLKWTSTGSDLRAVLSQVSRVAEALEAVLHRTSSGGFARHDSLGYVTVDAQHLGAGVQLTAGMGLNHLSGRPDFASLCAALGVQTAPAKVGGAHVEVSNCPAPHLSGDELADRMLRSCRILAHFETALEQGRSVDDQLRLILSQSC
ncbi:unnamed protein product, partial [Polarella glacialis]